MNKGTVGVNSLPKTVTRQRRDCDLNPGPSAPESSTLTTQLPSHPHFTLLNYRASIASHSAARVIIVNIDIVQSYRPFWPPDAVEDDSGLALETSSSCHDRAQTNSRNLQLESPEKSITTTVTILLHEPNHSHGTGTA